jgi:hypothetical protein
VDQDLLGLLIGFFGWGLVVGSVDEFAVDELNPGAGEGDEVGVRSKPASGLGPTR